MEINTIVEVNKNNYLLTQKVEYNNTNYFMAVAVNENAKMLDKYGIFKEIQQEDKILVDIIRDADEKKAVYELLVKDFNSNFLKDNNSMAIGQIVVMKNRNFALLDYIPFEGMIFIVFVSVEKPVDIVVCLRGVDEQGNQHLYDVTTEDIGVEVLRIFASIHKK